MTDTGHERVYTEKEIARILREASVLQEHDGAPPATGLSLSELRQLAVESGIDPRHIETAALALADRSDAPGGTLLGGPFELTVRRRIKGSVSDEMFARMVSEARRKLRKTGVTSQAGSTREWSAQSQVDASTSLVLRQHDGHTDLEIYWSESQVLPIPFIVVPILGIVVWIGVIINEMGLTGLPAVAAITTAILTYVLSAWVVFRAITKKQRQTIHELADRVATLAQEPGSRAPDRLPSADRAEPLIDLEDEPAEHEQASATRERLH